MIDWSFSLRVQGYLLLYLIVLALNGVFFSYDLIIAGPLQFVNTFFKIFYNFFNYLSILLFYYFITVHHYLLTINLYILFKLFRIFAEWCLIEYSFLAIYPKSMYKKTGCSSQPVFLYYHFLLFSLCLASIKYSNKSVAAFLLSLLQLTVIS